MLKFKSMLTLLESVAALATLICVILCRLQRKEGWYFNIISCVFLITLFAIKGIDGQLLLTIVYLVLGVIGLEKWSQGETITKGSNLGIGGLSTTLISLVPLVVIILFGVINTTVLDWTIVIISLLANILLIKKCIESWILWIVVNCLSIVLYLHTELYIMLGLYILLLLNSVYALLQWKKKLV